jgi:hypothetical protein
MSLTYDALFEKSMADLKVNRTFRVSEALRNREDRRVRWRVRGFVFRVDGNRCWSVDPPGLLRVGRWLATWDQTFTGDYVTDRHDGGFVVRFNHLRDAHTFEQQCLLNTSVFSLDCPAVMVGNPNDERRPATKQLPGSSPRERSKPIPDTVLQRMYYQRYYGWPDLMVERRIHYFENVFGKQIHP